MFHEQRRTVPDSPDELLAEYRNDLAAAVEDYGPEAAANDTDVDREAIDQLLEGDLPDLSLEEAAQLQALDERAPDAATIVDIGCEHLLLGMSTAVLDVDALETELAIEMDAKEIQQKIEQRAPMTFGEYVHIQYAIADNAP
ncbi:DUF5791 family protein [Halopiger xanaduensis]|nr:DUF5791 family protein [Halopiger xanaduensis]